MAWILRATLSLLIVAAGLAIIVLPIGAATSPDQNDAWVGLGAGLAVGLRVAFRGIGRRSETFLGWAVGCVVGIVATVVAGAIPGSGFLVLIPPILSTAVGFQLGLEGERVQTHRRLVSIVLQTAGLLLVGLVWMSFQWVASGLLAALPLTLLAGEVARARAVGEPPRHRVAYRIFLIIIVAAAWAAVAFDENEPWGSAGVLAVVFVYVVPLMFFAAARSTANLLRLNASMYRGLAEYARSLLVPFGGFALGYGALILIFAGFYGCLARIDGEAFSPEATRGLRDWLFFAFFVATQQPSSSVEPVSTFAQTIVGLQVIAGIGWAIVVFAMVNAHVQPLLARASTEVGSRASNDQEPSA